MLKLLDLNDKDLEYDTLQEKIGLLTNINKSKTEEQVDQATLTNAIDFLKTRCQFQQITSKITKFSSNNFTSKKVLFQKTFGQIDSSIRSNSNISQDMYENTQKQFEVSISLGNNNQEQTANRFIIIYFHDVTEYIANKILISNTKFQQQMMESFSHEVKTPLNGAIGPLERCVLNYQTSKQINYKEVLVSFRSLQMLHNILNDIVDFNYIITNQLSFQIEKQNFQTFVKNIIAIVSDLVQMKELQFVCDIDSNLPIHFRTDYQRLQQIILNLISNSLKFTLQGSIKLSIHYWNNLNQESPKNMIEFEIVDTGIGMDSSKQKKIQKLLQTTDLLENININKTGICLGLSISQILSQTLSPQNSPNYTGLFFQSSEKCGTEFKFYIQEKKSDTILSYNLGGSISNSDKSPQTLKTFSPFQLTRKEIKKSSLVLKQSSKFSEFPTVMRKSIGEQNHQIQMSKEIISSSPIKFQKKEFQHVFTFQNTDSCQFEESFENNTALQVIDQYQKCYLTASQKKFTHPNQLVSFKTPQFTNNEKSSLQRNIGPKNILIVDDDAFNLYTLELLLQKFNILIDKAYNGKQALDFVSQKSFLQGYPLKYYDLIFMDYQMPCMDGIESTKFIRKFFQKNNLEQIPIIACSAFEANSNVRNCLASGMNAYLKKPITFEMLSNVIYKYLN